MKTFDVFCADDIILPKVLNHLHALLFEAEARLHNIYKFILYRRENTTLLHYKHQFVSAVQGNNLCLLRESYKT
jgi:hypothetical protein